MHRHNNRLVNETSPYLLQHAHNPVDWYPWGEEALNRARTENKPILVSIGYAACHWCHVMERESFENEETAAFMNDHFINIKIDREERPDLDHIYMDAVQAMTGSGGWPLNVFLTPDTRPFYGGTYYPPVRAFNRASWMEVLQNVTEAFTTRRHEIDAQAENLTSHLVQSNSFGIGTGAGPDTFSMEQLKTAAANALKSADREWGGFGKAPKFPQTQVIRYLLRYNWTLNKNGQPTELARQGLTQALLSLDKMAAGGIYDQVGGGFARYSTDGEWLAPHFEKMLYDNALLITVYSEAYKVTGERKYATVIAETVKFLEREMLDAGGGFYAALDADSEGVEGKFYVWDKEEVDNILGADATVLGEYFDITAVGNWEGKNIPRLLHEPGRIRKKFGLDEEALEAMVTRGKENLLAARARRVRPQLDDKILLGWNALMNTALTDAYAATGIGHYLALAIKNMRFLLAAFAKAGGNEFFHTWKAGNARFPAFLDDVAFLVEALIGLQVVTGETGWLDKAKDITEGLIPAFSEEEGPYFYYTRKDQDDVILRKKEVYDGAVPSGNSVMAGNLFKLGVLYDRKDWVDRAAQMLGLLAPVIVKYPTSFGRWGCHLLEMTDGLAEIVITGKDIAEERKQLLKEYLPHTVMMSTAIDNQHFPLLVGKEVEDKPLFYLCKNYTCLRPVQTVDELMLLINSARNDN